MRMRHMVLAEYFTQYHTYNKWQLIFNHCYYELQIHLPSACDLSFPYSTGCTEDKQAHIQELPLPGHAVLSVTWKHW